ncbi:MAG: prolipoprotein diacylglyceryl transferase [Oligoflexus sp.]
MEYFVWDLNPEIFRWGPIAPRYYGVLFATGFLVGYQLMKSIFLAEGRKEEDLSSLLFYLMVGTIVGARLGHCLFYEPAYYLRNPLEMLKIWQGGLASHGGSIGVLLAAWLYQRKHPDQPYLWLADRLAIGVAFAAGCIRLGNFFNSEIIGKPTDVPWAIIFARIDQLPRHPAMLYESLSYFLLFALLWGIYKLRGPNIPQGRLLGIMLAWIFTSRIIIEFYKEDQVAFEAGMILNMGQLLSIPFVLLGILLFTGYYKQWLPDATKIKHPAGQNANKPKTSGKQKKRK